LVQAGIRDICPAEAKRIETDERIDSFSDSYIARHLYEGESWANLCDRILLDLTDCVYISFDIDGLDPKLCPNTGTPVPGGLDFNQVVYLFKKLVDSGRKIIGFDLCEVTPGNDEWDANVGARILYKLVNLMAKSNQL
jgi:agmatinase